MCDACEHYQTQYLSMTDSQTVHLGAKFGLKSPSWPLSYSVATAIADVFEKIQLVWEEDLEKCWEYLTR